MSFLTKGKAVAVVAEASYAAAAPVFTNADYVDYTAGDLTTKIDNLQRAVLRDSLVELAPILGQETCSGSLTVEVSGDNITAGVNGSKLLTNGIGKILPAVVATTISVATSTTVFDLTSVAGLAVGQALRVNHLGGDEYVIIQSIVGSTVTVHPALSVTPALADAVKGLTTFLLPRPSDSIASLAIREHLKPTTGNTIDYDYLGCMVSDVAYNFPVGNIATTQFTIAGANAVTTTPGSAPVLPCTLFTPVVGKNATLKVLGVPYTAQDLTFNVTTTMTDINSITTDGISNKLGTAKMVQGAFKTEYVGVTNFNTFKAGTTGELMLQVRDGGKTSPLLMGVFMPIVKFTEVTRTETSGILYDSIKFQALSPGCSGNELTVSVFYA